MTLPDGEKVTLAELAREATWDSVSVLRRCVNDDRLDATHGARPQIVRLHEVKIRGVGGVEHGAIITPAAAALPADRWSAKWRCLLPLRYPGLKRKRPADWQAVDLFGCGGAQPDPEALAYQVVTLSNKSNLPDLPFPFRAGAIARQHGGVNHVDRRTGGVSLHLGLFAASDG